MKKFFVLFIFFAFCFSSQALAFESLFYIYSSKSGLESFKKNSSQIDIIAPQIYTVNHSLKITGPDNKKLASGIKNKGADIVPLIVNAGFDRDLMSKILASEKTKKAIIDFMKKEAKKKKYKGWQFDFENLSAKDRDAYTDFVTQAGTEMKKAGLQFSVAVIPRSVDFNPTDELQDWSAGYDYVALAKSVDFLSIMSYDDPLSVGPVSSMPFMKKIYDFLLKTVPAEKISMGIPFYCWHWQKGYDKKLESINYSWALKLKKDTKAKESYDKELGAQKFTYVKNGLEHYIWCENGQSFGEKLDLMKKYNLRGFSVWSLGGEDKEIWKVLRGFDQLNQ